MNRQINVQHANLTFVRLLFVDTVSFPVDFCILKFPKLAECDPQAYPKNSLWYPETKWRKDAIGPSKANKWTFSALKKVETWFRKAEDGNPDCHYRNENQKVETEQFEKHGSIVGSDYSDYSQFPPSLPQTETQICISTMAFRSTAKRTPVNPVHLPNPEATPEAPHLDDARNTPTETDPDDAANEFPMPENPSEKEGGDVGNPQADAEENPAQTDAGVVLSHCHYTECFSTWSDPTMGSCHIPLAWSTRFHISSCLTTSLI